MIQERQKESLGISRWRQTSLLFFAVKGISVFPLYFLGYPAILILSALQSSLVSTLSSYLYSSLYKVLWRPTHRSPDIILSEQPLPSECFLKLTLNVCRTLTLKKPENTLCSLHADITTSLHIFPFWPQNINTRLLNLFYHSISVPEISISVYGFFVERNTRRKQSQRVMTSNVRTSDVSALPLR